MKDIAVLSTRSELPKKTNKKSRIKLCPKLKYEYMKRRGIIQFWRIVNKEIPIKKNKISFRAKSKRLKFSMKKSNYRNTNL